jgi:hypothetical protein
MRTRATPLSINPNLLGRATTKIEHHSCRGGPAIVDSHRDAQPVGQVLDDDIGIEGERTVGGGQVAGQVAGGYASSAGGRVPCPILCQMSPNPCPFRRIL